MFSAKHHATNQCPWLEPRKGDSHIPSWYEVEDTTYDTESGQVYTETRIRAPKKQKLCWNKEYKTPSLVKRRHANKDGAASLFDMAKAKVVREMRNLTASHLDGIPSAVGRKLWDEVENR